MSKRLLKDGTIYLKYYEKCNPQITEFGIFVVKV